MTTVDVPRRRARFAGPPPRRVLLVGGAILLAIVVVAVVAALTWRLGDHDRPGRTVTGPVDGRDHATLDLLTGVTSITVRGADLGDTLYRIRTPAAGGLVPGVTTDGDRVQVQLTGDTGGASAVVVELNRGVRWTVRFTGGATGNTADLSGIRRLAAVEYVGGVSSIDLTLPAPDGTVPVRVDSGAGTIKLHVPAGTAARVRAGGGAGSVTIDGTVHSGVTAGAVFASSGWETAADRYDLDSAAGVSSVVVDRA